jgi:adenylate cyclase
VRARAARRAAAGQLRRFSLLGAGLVLTLAVLTWAEPPWAERLQSAWFDAFQVLAPRQVALLPVTVVAIDQRSLADLGQWPWPRTRLAQLVRTIHTAGPAAIGLNILMPEPDALSPERLLAEAAVKDPSVDAALRNLMTHDSELAGALALAPSVLVVAGTQEATGMALRAAPERVSSWRSTPVR